MHSKHLHQLVYVVVFLLHPLIGGKLQSMFKRLFPLEHLQYLTAESLVGQAGKYGMETVRVEYCVLPFRNLASALPLCPGLTGCQFLGVLLSLRILICALFEKECYR